MTGGETVAAGPGPSAATGAASAAAADYVRRGLEAVRAQDGEPMQTEGSAGDRRTGKTRRKQKGKKKGGAGRKWRGRDV